MSELADFLHKLIDAIDRPADHPAAELHQEVDEALASTSGEAASSQVSPEEVLANDQEAPASPEAEPTPEPDTQPSEAVPPDLAAQPEEPAVGDG